MQKKALELSCYIAGAGAFGVFLRWLQVQVAFNELGLVDKSVFNVLVILFVVTAAIVYLRFLQQDDGKHLYVPDGFTEALGNRHKLFSVLCWLAGGVVVLGALLLLAKSETDKYVRFLRVLSALGVLSGVSVPLLLSMVNREDANRSLLCVLSMAPVLLFAAWLVYLYRANSINSVLWSYVPEIVTVIMAMIAFVRVAGFVFDCPNGQRVRFDVMLGATLCLMSLADERYMGMQLMLIGSALLLMLCNWALVCNLRQGEQRPQPKPDDGFEHL